MKCTWINHSDFTKRDTMLCGKRVGWRIVKDDDDNLVRKYNNLCDEHQKQADAILPKEEE